MINAGDSRYFTGISHKTCGQRDIVQVDVLQAVGLFALLAEEVDVGVVVLALALVFAELVAESAASVLKGVDYVVLKEQRQRAEDA